MPSIAPASLLALLAPTIQNLVPGVGAGNLLWDSTVMCNLQSHLDLEIASQVRCQALQDSGLSRLRHLITGGRKRLRRVTSPWSQLESGAKAGRQHQVVAVGQAPGGRVLLPYPGLHVLKGGFK